LCIDPTILTVNKIYNQQAELTESTAKSCEQLRDYLYTHPIATIHFQAISMVTSLVSDSAYPSRCNKPLCHPTHTVQPPYNLPTYHQV